MNDKEKIELVFLEFGLADSDAQLEKVLTRFLVPILLKLDSDNEEIKKKVIELLNHINIRVKSRTLVKLPVDVILTLFSRKDVSTFVTNFALIYLKMGFPRLDSTTKGELSPKFFFLLEGRSKQQQDIMLQLLLNSIQFVKLPDAPADRKNLFNFHLHPRSTKLVLDYFMDVLLLPYSYTADEFSSIPQDQIPVPPGLSKDSIRRITTDALFKDVWNPDYLEKLKLSILSIMDNDLFEEQLIVPHLICACADTKHQVSTNGDIQFKKWQSDIDWNYSPMIQILFRMYVGDPPNPSAKRKQTPEEYDITKRTPGNVRLKFKVLSTLKLSKAASEKFPMTIQLIYNGLFSEQTTSKLQTMTLQFVHHICDRCDLSKLKQQAPLILEALLKVIRSSEAESKNKCLAYTALGKLFLKIPKGLPGNFELLKENFKSLQEETAQDLKLAIQECLAMMSASFKDITNTNNIEAIVNQYINVPCHMCRLSAIRYAGVVFPTNHIPTRYLLLLASTDVKEDVAIEARQLLSMDNKEDNLHKSDENETKKNFLPQFTDMLNFTYEEAKKRKSSSLRHSVGNQSIAYKPTLFIIILKYLRKCLLQDACDELGKEPQSFSEINEQSPVLSLYIRNEMGQNKSDTLKLMSMYVKLSMQLLRCVPDIEAMHIFLESVMIMPEDVSIEELFALTYPSKDAEESLNAAMTWIKSLVFHTKDMIRTYGAELYTEIISRVPSLCDDETFIDELLKNIKTEKKYELKHGSIVLSGYYIGEYFNTSELEMIPLATKEILASLVDIIENERDKLLVSSACTAIGEIGRRCMLPIDNGNLDEQKEEDEEAQNKNKTYQEHLDDLSKLSIIKVLLRRLNSNCDGKIKEKCADALGRFSVGEVDFPHARFIIDKLMKTSNQNTVELQFTVAKALASTALGTKSNCRNNRWTYLPDNDMDATPQTSLTPASDNVGWLIDTVLNQYVCHKKSSARQASCIWLMTFLRQSEMTSHSAIKDNLPQIQSSFMSMLVEQDSLTQDIASKGLGVVYELGSEEQKQMLVSSLVNSLTDGKQATKKDDEQRDLFKESGGLGKAPDGSKLSTYKELCSLATDLNQPDLIYKFLHLSRHNATWNTKKGAAFGFSSIVSLATEDLEPHMPLMVPRLYRYTFDPQPGVRHAMTEIWHAISPNPKTLVDKYLKEILADLSENLNIELWRSRQASCLALADLLKGGRGFRGDDEAKLIISALPDMWFKVMRAMDDIKETVRDAAEIAAKSLKTITIKFCDSAQGKDGQEAITNVLPVLIEHGLQNNYKTAAKLSLSTLSEISKKCGELIEPCLPQMVIALLEALLNFEPKELRYLSVISETRTRDAVDELRANSVSTSPMMETIDRCLKFVTSDTLGRLIPLINDFLKRSVDVMSKVGCCMVITKLVEQRKNDITPFTSSIINRLISGLTNNSLAIRKHCANALGNVISVAKDATVQKTMNKLKSWYIENEDENSRHASALAFTAISKYSPDVANNNLILILPLAFFGMHEKINLQANSNNKKKDIDNLTPNLWKKIWNDFTPGIASAITLYLTELIKITASSLSSQQWKVKAQGADAMATIARQHKPGTIIGDNLIAVVEILQDNLKGRTWDGKEQLVVSLRAFAVHCKEHLPQDEVTKIVQLMFKECQRDSINVYKVESINTLAKILHAHEINKFQHFWNIIEPIINKKKSDEDSDEESNDKTTNTIAETLLETSIEACGSAWLKNNGCIDSHLIIVLESLSRHAKLNLWKIQLASLKSLNSILQSITENTNILQSSNIEAILKTGFIEALCTSLENKKYSRIKKEAFDITKTFSTMIKNYTHPGDEGLKKLLETLTATYADNTHTKDSFNEIVKNLKNTLNIEIN